jgi:hypothetical protein
VRTVIVEKHPDMQFDNESQATLRINSIHLPDLILKGTKILQYPLYMKPVNGDLSGLEINCKLTPEMISRGVILLGAYIDGDNICVGINGDCRIPENFDAFRISFLERVQVRSITPTALDASLTETLKEITKPKKKGKK